MSVLNSYQIQLKADLLIFFDNRPYHVFVMESADASIHNFLCSFFNDPRVAPKHVMDEEVLYVENKVASETDFLGGFSGATGGYTSL